jgi:1-acyl-sn-glycerol-3-phosphate acyltransferase
MLRRKNMIKTLFFFMYFGLSLLLSMIGAIPYLIFALFGRKESQKSVVEWQTRAWAKSIIFFTGNRIQVENADKVPSGPVLFVANHQSYFDIPVLMVHLPYFAAFIAKVELEKIPMLSWWMKKMGCLFMDRKNMRQSLNIILQGIEMLKEGKSLVIFPEGTRSHLGQIDAFKPGSLKLAVKAGVPIVPVAIVNTYKVYEEHKRIRKADVTVVFHDPIDVTVLSREQVNDLHNKVHTTIKKTLER